MPTPGLSSRSCRRACTRPETAASQEAAHRGARMAPHSHRGPNLTDAKVGPAPHVPTDETRNLVESLSGFGIPQTEIARLVGIDPKTLRFHYEDQLDLGAIKASAKVAQNLFTMACKPTREGLSAAIFWLKVRAG